MPYTYDDVAQHDAHTGRPRQVGLVNVQVIASLYMFDIGHPCYGQLTGNIHYTHVHLAAAIFTTQHSIVGEINSNYNFW